MTDLGFLRRAWQDMCATYRDADLARACLDMQETHGVDVPLLLVLCIADRARHGLDRGELQALIAESEEWRETVIGPLRHLRQTMKGHFTAPAEIGLRDDIKRLELETERLHVQRLIKAFSPSRPNAESAALQYLAMQGVSTEAASDFLRTFNHAYAAQVLPVAALN